MSAPLALPAAQTRASMLQTLRTRCGLHATLGAASALEDILTEANEYVYQQLDDGLPWRSTLTLLANTAEYEFLTDDEVPIARGSVQSIWIEQGDSVRVPLTPGITHAMRADQDLRDIPSAWDTKMVGDVWTLEVWSTPDQSYVLHVDHNRVLTRFSEATDKPSAPYRLVLGYAIAMGKAHYGKPDAETAGQAFKTMLSKEKFKQKENRRFVPPSADVLTHPRVVSTASGFRQVW